LSVVSRRLIAALTCAGCCPASRAASLKLPSAAARTNNQIFQPEHADSPLLQIAPKIRITVAAKAAQDLRRVLLTLLKIQCLPFQQHQE
jgi:hypothetical protein